MNEQQRKELYTKAIERWNRKPQEDTCIEECSELIKAILKLRRYEEYSSEISEERVIELKADLLDELADVFIMCEQVKVLHNFDEETFQQQVDKKLERTKKRLDGE